MNQDPSQSDPNPYAAPPAGNAMPPQPPGAPNQEDGTGGVIPYKNPNALIAYYLGIFSLIPCLGLFLAIPALVLGFLGLKKAKENPAVKGTVHAWIGIVMGGIFTLVWGITFVLIVISAMANA